MSAIEARHAVIATGAATGLLMTSGFLHARPQMMLAARAYASGVPDSDAFRLLFGGVPQPGYGWSFPVGDGLANIGVGFLPTHTTKTARQVFERWSHGATVVGAVKGYPIRVDFLRAPTHAPRTLLVGEAAGLVNPLTGEGIDYALESGQIAADILARSAPESEYHVTLHQRFGQVFRFSEHVRDWYCKPLLLNALVPLANRYPELRQQLATVVLGERQPAGFGPLEMLARLVVYLVRYRPRSLNRP
jgi:flavin-dependent dehydrogenase